MKIAKENVDVKMEIPGATVRQRINFGDASGYGKISGEYFSLSAGVDTTPFMPMSALGVCYKRPNYHNRC